MLSIKSFSSYVAALLIATPVPTLMGVIQTQPTNDAAGAQVEWRECQVPNLEGETVRCGRFEVFEDRVHRTGRRIGLNLVVVKALESSSAEPVFWLHGGPGAAATQLAGAARGGFLQGLHKSHDLVFVDQRGTGASNPLNCKILDDPNDLTVYFGPLFPGEIVRSCRKQLEKQADLRLYTTPLAMDDVDDVRAALGYKKISLVAASYGTIAAQVFMRQHPDSVRSVFLLGVATPGVKQPLLFAKAAQHAMDLLLVDCDADETCHKEFPNLKTELAEVLDRFKNGAVQVTLVKPDTREKQAIMLTREDFVERIRLLLYTTTFARFVPLIIHRAAQDDFLPFESLAIAYNPGALLSRGVYFTITCSEGVPFITPNEISSEAVGTFVGETRVRAHIKACKDWPRGDIPARFIEPVHSDIPVLMISGELDGSSPPWFAENAVKTLSHGRQIKIRYYGHQLDSPCVWELLDQFIEKGSAEALKTSCTEQVRRPPFATSIPREIALQ